MNNNRPDYLYLAHCQTSHVRYACNLRYSWFIPLKKKTAKFYHFPESDIHECEWGHCLVD